MKHPFKIFFFVVSLSLILQACSSKVNPFTRNSNEDARFLIEVEGKTGYIDEKGTIVIQPKYEDGKPFSEGLAAVRLDDRWGFIDIYGKLIIDPVFGMGTSKFQNGLAAARVVDGPYNWNGPMGFIDKDGSFEVTAGYEEVKGFSDGLAPAKDEDGGWGIIDRYGNMRVPFKYEDIGEFSEGLAYAKSEGKYGFINKKGDVVVPHQYADAADFTGGVAPVLIAYGDFDRWWAFINKDGSIAIEDGEIGNIPVNAPKLSEGLICILDPATSKYGYMNSVGEWVLKPEFDWAYAFSDGLASVNKEGKWGFIDKKGQVVINYQDFEEGSLFFNGLAAISLNGSWNNYINKKGEFVYTDKK